MSRKILQQFNNNSKIAFVIRLFVTLGLMAGITYGALFYFDFLNANKPNIPRKPAKEQAATVDTLTIDFEDIQPLISNFGQIITAKQLPLSTSVSGRVNYISENFKIGAIVKKGELLLELNDFEYLGNVMVAKASLQDIGFKTTDIDNQIASTEINYDSTKQLYENAQQDYEGSIKLQKSGIISKQALDDKNQALIQQKQSLDMMTASFANLKNQKLQLLATTEMQEWAVNKAEKDLESTKIYAPFDAYIHNANLEIGQHIGANTPIATLLDQKKIDVKFTLSDGQYGRIIAQDGTIIGRKITAIWQIGQIEKIFEAVINRVNSEIVAASGGIDLYASIINVEAVEALRIGAFVKVQIPDQTYEQIIKIPEFMIYDNDVVYVVVRANPNQQPSETATETEIEDEANEIAAQGEKPPQGQRPKQRQGEVKPKDQRPTDKPNGERPNADKPVGEKLNDKKPDDKNPDGEKPDDKKPDGKKPEEELKVNEKRLEPVKVQIIGYDGDQILIVNLPDSENPLEAGDALLQTRLTLAGKGVLVITTEESARKQAEALEKLKQKDAENGGNGNRRFGRRGGNLFGGTGGRR